MSQNRKVFSSVSICDICVKRIKTI
ncbi:MAG: hypothetical protein IJW39_02615, partial [Opitutales bacterium]|nr:hypothetical protein [Opitutales bacterium]